MVSIRENFIGVVGAWASEHGFLCGVQRAQVVAAVVMVVFHDFLALSHKVFLALLLLLLSLGFLTFLSIGWESLDFDWRSAASHPFSRIGVLS